MAQDIIIDYDAYNHRAEAQKFINDLPHHIQSYLISLFPIATWIHRYNLTWLIRDIIAGVTVGIVVVPQSMGYAKIAELPPQYGLYTAFVGLCVYCLFATSKDISIGPTAVMSLLVGQTITKITTQHPDITPEQIAVAFSLMTGAIAMFIGLVRLGILVDLIPGPAIAGFMTGSAISISIGQWPKLFGISGVNTQNSSYLIFGNFFKHLPSTKVDAAFGLIGLLWLYGIRYGCSYLQRRYPKYSNHFFFFSIMRNGLLVIFGTLISYLINIGKEKSPISILKNVPPGFQAMAVPDFNTTTLSGIASSLPSGVIILILEHVAIAKSFGRINDYAINPNQEIIAIGFTNIWASFFGAYPSTGSFSRTAIKSRSGVKTPIAGIFSGIVVILALYALTPAFYYIPDAILAAVVIHAVSDLVSGPAYLKRLAAVSIWELCVFAIGVIITFFTTVEYGIYASTGLSALILFFRIARPRVSNLSRIPVNLDPSSASSASSFHSDEKQQVHEIEKTPLNYMYVPEDHPSLGRRSEPLPAGILMIRVDESFCYPNSSYIAEYLINYCKSRTRRMARVMDKGDRAWNDDATPETEQARLQLPRLHALILDFSAVNRLDSTGLQGVVDAQNALNRYADQHVEFHFVNIATPAIRRSLLVAGFGTQPRRDEDAERVNTDNSAASQGSHLTGPAEVLPVVPPSKDGPEYQQHHSHSQQHAKSDIESSTKHYEAAHIINVPRDRYPFFHWSSDEAVRSALKTIPPPEDEDAKESIQEQL
ncbi:sulfate transporter family-domain-containing protein [Syncephalastrum racemosum]|uniref:Sulfate transporter family-domain-containing protein n=1 Tax=Syncephalastrum racemosum TaxID=13706 RepID=A0A1X2HQ40_SYNRA|nr:sulfate transporter family-domain-containing protein [Syncephalastrum racemosum]